jgi:processive 1,2-diacylglycerol beta-glucosyltransferase
MSLDRLPRILIATAGFGDGHNSAARNLAKALTGSADVRVIDPCAEGSPWLNKVLRGAYRFVTTYLPGTWNRIYQGVEKRDFNKQELPLMGPVERAFSGQVDEFDPDVIVSTYPLYPYFAARHIGEEGRRRPLVTIVTDSIEINAAWRRAPTDYWLVTDQETRRGLIEKDLPGEQIIESGFPVDPVLATLTPLPADTPARPFRILFFPTAKRPAVRRTAEALLEHDGWPTELTMVLGRNLRRLYKQARELSKAYPGRVQIKGWSRRVPQLLCNHHLVVGKAGGATVHEALAAQCPMLIHHLVPGQEEGNLELLRRIGGGDLADTDQSLAAALRDLLADNAAVWRRQKQHLIKHARPHASHVAAQFVLELAARANS